jgi:hypothetical protein
MFTKENNIKTDDFPKECLSDVYTQKIKERSWKMENALSMEPRTKQQFDLDFEKGRVKFCSLDIGKVMQLQAINNFLGSRYFSRHRADEEETAKKCHYYSSIEDDPENILNRFAKDECTNNYIQGLMRKYPKKNNQSLLTQLLIH